MELRIYDQTGGLRAVISPDDSSTQQKAVMGDNTLGVSFTTGEAIPFDVNDYVDFEGERYTLMSVPCPRQASTVEYEYTLRFHGVENELSKALCFLMTDGGMDSDFALTDGPATHLQLVVDNINRIKGSTAWRIGSVIAADYKVITYDGIDCLTALNRIAETFETEWWIVGTTIYLGKCEHGELLELGYAADGTAVGGLLNMSKREEENDSFFTRLYAKGSTRNIDRSRYGSDYLHLPSPLRYLEKNTGYGIVEREVIFDTVYPRRVGTLSGARSIERESEGKTIRIYYVTDKDIPFNPNEYEIAGLTKHVKFETGELSGYDFEINYDSSTGEFELINQYPDENGQIPGGVMIPKAGDTYILYNIRMPDEYYALAEKELKETSEAYLDKHSVDSSVYSGDSDPIILRKREVTVTLGQRVRLYNPVFFSSGYRDSRIIGFTRNLNDPYDVKVDISEYVSIGRMESLERKVDSFLPMISQAGGSINIIKSGDDTVPTDNNVFSALKAISTFLRKDQPDQTNYPLKLLGGLISDNIESQDFAAGPFGTGLVLKRNAKTGKSYMEIDELYVRLKAYFDTLEIKHLSHVGGRIVLSPAGMECIRVEKVSAEYEIVYDSMGMQVFDSTGEEILAPMDGGEMAYRCYFRQSDGDKEIVNEFAVDDLAQCREFNVKTGVSHNVSNQYYWRRVIHVGEDYIDLSITDCDTGSTEPKAGDTIVTIGNKTDKNRQHVVYLSSYDEDAPCFKLYSGINSYSMLNKEVTVISPNADKNVFTGKMLIKPGSTGFENLTDAPDMGEVNEAIQDAKNTANNAQEAVNGVQGSVTSLKGYVDGAFSDGIISEAEAKSIEKYINTVNQTKKETDSTYTALYINGFLSGIAKSNLYTAKNSFNTATSNLIAAINAAIADGKTTTAEKNNVDSKFTAFNNAYASLATAIENANKAIQDKIKQEAVNESKDNASSQIQGMSQEVKDDFAKKLGYKDYEDLVSTAYTGNTIIDPNTGVFNTRLIEASVVITSKLLADAIMTSTLNVNNNLYIEKDGSVRTKGGNLEMILTKGYLRGLYKDVERLRLVIDESLGDSELYLTDRDRSASYRNSGVTYTLKSGKTLLLDPEEIGSGVIYARSDGTLAIKDKTQEYISVYIRVSPSGGGTTSPAAGSYMVKQGSREIVSASPASGYRFDRWSDGGSQSHEVLWDLGKTLTAYFTRIETTKYTVVLLASPASGGTTSGSGTFEAGTVRTVSATANPGYRFIRWSDGKAQSHSVTWDSNKTLIAYFERYSVSGDEIFSGTSLTSLSYWKTYGGVNVELSGGVAALRFGTEFAYACFNRGYLGSKLEQGHIYRLSMEMKVLNASSESQITVAVGFYGYVDEYSNGPGENISSIGAIKVTTSYMSYEFDLTMNEDATIKTSLAIMSNNNVFYIRKISLKEI